MDAMSEHQHGHIPYLAILLHYLEKWKLEHGARLPGTYNEKNEFKKVLLTGMRTDVAGGSEENWEEAVAAVLANVKPHEINSGIREVLEDDRCQNLDQDVSPINTTAFHAFNTNAYNLLVRKFLDYCTRYSRIRSIFRTR